MAGSSAAWERGLEGGRKPKPTRKQIAHARKLLDHRDTTAKDVAASLGVSRATLYRVLDTDPAAAIRQAR